MSTNQPSVPTVEPPNRRRLLPRWRKATWALAIWNVVMLVWIIGGVSSSGDVCADETGTEFLSAESAREACEAGAAIGTGIGVAALFILWFVGFIILSLIWLMSRPRQVEVRIVQ